MALDTLEKKYGGNFEVVGIEVKVTFPGVPGGFGTSIWSCKMTAIYCCWIGSLARASP